MTCFKTMNSTLISILHFLLSQAFVQNNMSIVEQKLFDWQNVKNIQSLSVPAVKSITSSTTLTVRLLWNKCKRFWDFTWGLSSRASARCKAWIPGIFGGYFSIPSSTEIIVWFENLGNNTSITATQYQNILDSGSSWSLVPPMLCAGQVRVTRIRKLKLYCIKYPWTFHFLPGYGGKI